ncbi:PREDICTED: uncharacterized protein LOC107185775 [Dufourea novaeangliae]|uniref:Ras guanine nucleotide exchange factor E n=1 Tax=Dufourea novaeangliae TaxID=178035 RepID=A0A154P8I8_DUFNO|nr:PREDICTED: uncharacterized protein LOC107185775 [Dufourea novaeangliae]KZC07664.1 Ras guanine nucleotide exchange factor E [Dufourea novaeangliae]
MRTHCRRAKIHDVEHKRIQKLLASEYSDFSDTILVESPFAETSKHGRGIRQVSLGLTPTKLIIAADIFRGMQHFCPRGLDPSIESFELISMYPLQYVNLSVFSRRHRKTLKARFSDGRANYYELGGIQKRNIFWSKWCDEVESLLRKRRDRSSLSETTAATSSSTTTLYLLSSEIEIRKGARKKGRKAMCRVWAHYGGAGDSAPPTWTQKDLYLGPNYNDLTNGQYAPVPVRFADVSLEDVQDELKDRSPSKGDNKVSFSWPMCSCLEKNPQNEGLCDVLFIRDQNHRYCNTKKFYTNCSSCPCQNVIVGDKVFEKRNVWYKEEEEKLDPLEEAKLPKKCLTGRISRFGFGVAEKCNSGLVLKECYPVRNGAKNAQNFCLLMENAVKLWEDDRKGRCRSSKRPKHFRRYGLCAAAHFLHSLGPWSVQPGERSSLQGRRSFSLVAIRRQPADTELKLPVSRRQLSASISYTALQSGRFGSIGTGTEGRVVLFWTPDYWYRPRPATAAYRELRQHLNHLKNYRQEKERPMKRNFFSRRKKCHCDEDSIIVAEEKPSFLERIFSGNGSTKRKKKHENQENDHTVQLRRMLRMDFRITIWDMDSSTLATQVTLIDRDLFVRIPADEIEIVIFQRSSRNAPNLAAWIAFSHRVSCLVTSEIVVIKKLSIRCRIIARLVNAACKCFAMGNFHSCRSILAGLQAPPIYRLRRTWSYLRVHHANRYEAMERLCKLYKSPYTPSYRRAWSKVERNPPSMPFVGDLLTKLLGLSNTGRHQEFNNNFSSVKAKIFSQYPKDTDPSYVTKASSDLKGTQVSEEKQGVGRRILSVLIKRRYRQNQGTIPEEQSELLWTSRDQDLAWKYYYHWRNVILKRRVLAKEQERLRSMDPRMKRVLDVASWLADCQKRAREYDFPGHSFTKEFLLKSRYREDRENFFISLKLEPSKIT